MNAPPPDYVPPPWLEFVRRHIWAISFVLGAAAITAVTPYMRHVPDAPAPMFELPDYTLVDHRGESFTPETLQGKVWIAGFVFTSCPSTCPMVTGAMAELRSRLDKMDIPVEMVSFTVDPTHDTPEVLAEYAQDTGVDTDNWRFVTGHPDAVLDLVQEGFRLGVGDRQATGDGIADDIAHSTKLALVGPDGHVRGFYDIDPEHGTDEVYHRAQHVLRDARRANR